VGTKGAVLLNLPMRVSEEFDKILYILIHRDRADAAHSGDDIMKYPTQCEYIPLR